MPVIRLGGQDTELEGDAQEEQEEEEEDMEEEGVEVEVEDEDIGTEPEDEKFMGHELDTILESAGRTETAVKDFAMTDAPEQEAPAPAIIEQPPSTQRETRSSTESAKRAQLELAPSLPSKRLKTGEAQDFVTTTPMSLTTSERSASSSLPLNTVPQTSEFTVSSTASAVPQLGGVTVDGQDSDEDDVVSLVLGQDTDDESE
jgi:pre-rRNA-processing protein RIX1